MMLGMLLTFAGPLFSHPYSEDEWVNVHKALRTVSGFYDQLNKLLPGFYYCFF